MQDRFKEDLERWLAAELAAGDEAAESAEVGEAAFALLMAELPRAAPSPGFAERVLHETRRQLPGLASAWRPIPAPWPLRLLVLSLLLASGALVFTLPALLRPVLVAFGYSEAGLPLLLTLLTDGLVALTHLLAGALGLWQRLGERMSLVGELAHQPAVALAVSSALMLAGAAFMLLSRMISRERKPDYASA